MKKLLLGVVTALFSFGGVQAQLADYSVAPDFTVTDINGTQHNLYTYLDQGKTVFIDLFATWCGPCWNYHNYGTSHPSAGALKDLYNAYGPGGTDEVVVIAIESDNSTTLDDLNGTGGNTTGDWVTGTPYPMVDDASVASAYNLAYYPTIFMICPNRMVFEIGQQSVANLYSASGTCPGVATNMNDAAALTYRGDEVSYCGDANMGVLIQNMGTSALTSATIEVKENGSTVATQTWSGNLPTYQTETVSIPNVSLTGAGGVTIEITSSDDDATNNSISASLETVVMSNGPIDQTNESSTGLNDLPDGVYLADNATTSPWVISKNDLTNPPAFDLGGFGNSEKSMFFYFFDWNASTVASVVLERIDFSAMSGTAKLDFSHAYAQYSNENDELVVEVSTDCGATWTEVWSKAGADLKTADAVTSFFVPETTQWSANSVDLSAYDNESNVLIRFTGNSGYGNNLYVDDIKVSSSVSIEEQASLSTINMFPNPATNEVNLTFTLAQQSEATITVYNTLGAVVYNRTLNAVGTTLQAINTADFGSGVYFVELSTGNESVTKKLIIE